MDIIVFQTTLHCERVWAYLVRSNGTTICNGYAPTQKEAEEKGRRHCALFEISEMVKGE